MNTNARFVKSVIRTAEKSDQQMPWTRGARRAAFIARRDTALAPRKSA